MRIECKGPFAYVELYSPYRDATVTAAGACTNARQVSKGLHGAVMWEADIAGNAGDLCEVTATVAGEPPLTKSATIGWSEDCGAFVAVDFQFP